MPQFTTENLCYVKHGERQRSNLGPLDALSVEIASSRKRSSQ